MSRALMWCYSILVLMPFELSNFETDQRKPIDVVSGFMWDRRNRKYTAPFASEKETHGHLSGSESTTLMSRFGEPVFSMGFVQCSSALVKNRQNGIITLIHQSLWSDSASVALGLQRMDDIDVITISDQAHGIKMKNIVDTHGISSRELGHMVNPALERSKIVGGVKLERSEILGL